MKNFAIYCFLAMLAGCVNSEHSMPPELVKIGATLPLSGDAAQWGKNTQDGINMALDKINKSGGVLGREVMVVYEDTRALPKEGVTAYRKLLSFDKVEAIIDDSVSGITLAMAPLAEADKVVILATGATSPKITNAGKFIYRIWNSDSYEGEMSANFAFTQMKTRRAAVLYINNDYGNGLELVFKTVFRELGGDVTASESFKQGSTDMRTQLTKVKNSNPETVYLVGYPKEIPVALRQIRELGIKVSLLGTVAMQDEQLLTSAGDSAEGLMFPFPLEPAGSHVGSFKKEFKAKYNREPGLTADVGYDSINMIVEAIKLSGGASGDEIREGLDQIRNYPGVSGQMTFDINGDVQKPMAMKIVENGEFNWFKK